MRNWKRGPKVPAASLAAPKTPEPAADVSYPEMYMDAAIDPRCFRPKSVAGMVVITVTLDP